MSSFIPWVGGKTRLADTIIKMFPPHTAYVEPFLGGGGIFFKKEPSNVEIINDINKELITLYRVVRWHREEFSRQFENILISRDEFYKFKATLPETLTDIQRAVRFFYLQKLGFGGKVVSSPFGTSPTKKANLNLAALDKMLFEVHKRLERVTVECLPYDDLIPRYDRPGTLFYLDPPYYGTEKYYGKDFFSRADYTKLAEILSGLKGKFLFSINDCQEIREIFAEFDFTPLQTTYSVGTRHNKAAKELVYRNF